MKLAALRTLPKQAVEHWGQDQVPRLAASLAFYTILSLAPLLLIAITVAGSITSAGEARGRVVQEITALLGPDGARAVQSLVEATQRRQGSGTLRLVVGFVFWLFAAGALFSHLQDALNTVWHIARERGRGLRRWLKDRFLSLATAVGLVFLLLVSLVVSGGVGLLAGALGQPIAGAPLWLRALFALVSVGVIAAAFALLYWLLPDAEVAWRDIWLGALATSLLFNLGRLLLGLYVGHSRLATDFGAGGAILLVLLWVYYSALLVLLGAEFTRAYAEEYGSGVRPKPGAERVAEVEEKGGDAKGTG